MLISPHPARLGQAGESQGWGEGRRFPDGAKAGSVQGQSSPVTAVTICLHSPLGPVALMFYLSDTCEVLPHRGRALPMRNLILWLLLLLSTLPGNPSLGKAAAGSVP